MGGGLKVGDRDSSYLGQIHDDLSGHSLHFIWLVFCFRFVYVFAKWLRVVAEQHLGCLSETWAAAAADRLYLHYSGQELRDGPTSFDGLCCPCDNLWQSPQSPARYLLPVSSVKRQVEGCHGL